MRETFKKSVKSRKLTGASALALLLCAQSPAVLAQCVVTGAGTAAAGGDVVVCAGPAADADGHIGTNNGDEFTVIAGAAVSSLAGSTLRTELGSDYVEVLGGNIVTAVPGGEYGVFLNGDNTNASRVDFRGGNITGAGGIRSRNNTSTISVSGGVISVTLPAINIENSNLPATINISGGRIGTVGSAIFIHDALSVAGPPATITISNGDISAVANGVYSLGRTTLNMAGGNLSGGGRSIETGGDNDFITLTGGTITGDIDANGDNDTFTLNGATVDGTVELGTGNDIVNLLSGSVIWGHDVNAGPGDDTVMWSDAVVSGTVDGGLGTDDTLDFTMSLTPTDSAALEAYLIANPSTGTITLSGTTYDYTNFENLLIRGRAAGAPVRAVPTMSQWMLVLLSGLLMLCAVPRFGRNWRF